MESLFGQNHSGRISNPEIYEGSNLDPQKYVDALQYPLSHKDRRGPTDICVIVFWQSYLDKNSSPEVYQESNPSSQPCGNPVPYSLYQKNRNGPTDLLGTVFG